VPTIYDVGGSGKFVLASMGKRGKAVHFEAQDITASGKRLAEINLQYDTSFRSKKFKKTTINFASDIDPVLKPQLVLSSLMIMYIYKMV